MKTKFKKWKQNNQSQCNVKNESERIGNWSKIFSTFTYTNKSAEQQNHED